jgi:hypothetical protein
MGVGLAGLQIVGFKKALGTYGPGHALFLSATLDSRWLSTVEVVGECQCFPATWPGLH